MKPRIPNLVLLSVLALSAGSGFTAGNGKDLLENKEETRSLETVFKEPELADFTQQREFTFQQLGTSRSLPMRGGSSSVGIRFGVRQDELVTRARLKLAYVYSPSLIENLSHVKVYLNEEVVGILPMDPDYAGDRVLHELELNPVLVSDYNLIRLQMIGHYTVDRCEDPLHTSLWADVSGDSRLLLEVQPLAMANELGSFPEPFFDRRDSRRLTLPFVFARKPAAETLEAAGMVSSWFGAEAEWRGARFPVRMDTEPERHAVVFAANDNRPAILRDYPKVDRPTIAITSLPEPLPDENGRIDIGKYKPHVKLLLILGRDSADLKTAAKALVLGQAVLSGSRATVKQVNIGPKRSPYDAPNWVRLDRPTKLGELVPSLNDLQASGRVPETIRVNVRVPADLFTWRSRGVPVDLNYRYTPLIEKDESRLNVSINEDFVEAFNLRESGVGGIKKRVRVPLLEESLLGSGNQFFIPAFKLGSNNQLQFDFSFGYHKKDLCENSSLDNVKSSIDADSTIDFTGFPHFVAMPNLGFFANSGYPFTRFADLSETVAVLPAQPDHWEIESLLSLIGKLSASTGYPATRLQLSTPEAMLLDADKDILLIGSRAHDSMLERWNKDLPANLSRLGRELGLPIRAVSLLNDWLGFETDPDPTLGSTVILQSQGPIASLIGFESPQVAKRSVVSVIGASNRDLDRVLKALENPTEVAQMRGSTVLLRNNSIESLLVGDTYTVGHLSLVNRVWYFLANHPVILVLLTLFSVLVIASLLWRALRIVMLQRLDEDAR